jgi:flagellar biogenesis protein FliO
MHSVSEIYLGILCIGLLALVIVLGMLAYYVRRLGSKRSRH